MLDVFYSIYLILLLLIKKFYFNNMYWLIYV